METIIPYMMCSNDSMVSLSQFARECEYEVDLLVEFPSTMNVSAKAMYIWEIENKSVKHEMALAILLWCIEGASRWRVQEDEEEKQAAWREIRYACSHMKSVYSETRVRLYLDRAYHNAINPNIVKQNWFAQ